MNRDELDGKAEALKGKVKQAAGDLTDDQNLHDEGVADEAAGDTQAAIGEGRRKVGEFVKDVGDAIKK
ncbi:MAG: CsbD family protein [Luteitalea sp.]|nr:CsbD family protein [Luteitalea sp.]